MLSPLKVAVQELATRRGSSWDHDEVERLKAAFHRGVPFKEIASSHRRSRGAIISRLRLLELVPEDRGDSWKPKIAPSPRTATDHC